MSGDKQHGTVNVGMGTILEPWEYTLIGEYLALVLLKIERGRGEHGMDYLDRSPEGFRKEIDNEIADITGWAAMQYVALHAPADAARAAKLESPIHDL